MGGSGGGGGGGGDVQAWGKSVAASMQPTHTLGKCSEAAAQWL